MATLASALAARSLRLQDAALASQCVGIMTELGVTQEDFLDELDAISASSNGASIGRSQLDTARKSLEKRVQRVARYSATPATKFDKSTASGLPGFHAESSMRPPASSSTPSMPTPAAKRAAASSASSASARPSQTSPVFSSTSKTPSSSNSKVIPTVLYADRTNAGEVLDVYTPTTRTLPMPDVCGALARPSIDAIRAAGAEFAAGLSRFAKAPGRLLDTPVSTSSPLPLTCAGIDAYAAVMGLKLVHPLAARGMPVEASIAPVSAPAPTSPMSSSPGAASASAAVEVASAEAAAADAMDLDPSPSSAAVLRSILPLCAPVDRNAHDAFRWMFMTKEQRVENLDGRISEMEDAIGAVYGVTDDIVPLGSMSQEPVTYVGRVVVDGEGRINPSSILLEGSTFNTVPGLPGNRIHVDVTDIPAFSVFPGQILGVRGLNARGARLVAQRIYHGAPPPPLLLPARNARALSTAMGSSGPARVWVAAGPFCSHSDIAFAPLSDLFMEAKAAAVPPDTIILMGPFVEAEHPRVKDMDLAVTDAESNEEYPATFQNVWEWIVCAILQDALSSAELSRTHVVILPSGADINHDACFPQSSIRREELDGIEDPSVRERITLVSNPGTFFVNGVLFGAACTDTLMHLTSDNATRAAGGAALDRLARMAQHVLEQRSYYPMYPPGSLQEAPLELSQLWHVGMSAAPDVLLLPSKLKVFAKPIADTLVINPGIMCRGYTGGSYARMFIFPQTPADLKTVAVVDPDNEEPQEFALNSVPERTRVEVLRI